VGGIRNSTLDLIDKIPYLKYFPSAKEFNEKRIPSQRNVIDKMKINGFLFLRHEIVQQQFSDSLYEYCDKIRQRDLSDLAMISDDKFEAGVHRMQEDVEKNEKQDPILELIDLFTFRLSG
jgi:hypothetical protein